MSILQQNATQVKAPIAPLPRVVHDGRRGRRLHDVRPGDLVLTESGLHECRQNGQLFAWPARGG